MTGESEALSAQCIVDESADIFTATKYHYLLMISFHFCVIKLKYCATINRLRSCQEIGKHWLELAA
jgi:hypothetical protein